MLRHKRWIVGPVLALLTVVVIWWAANPAQLFGPKIRARFTRELARLAPVATLGDDVTVSLRGRVTVGPIDLALDDQPTPRIHIERVTVSARLWSLVRGNPEISYAEADNVTVDLGDDPSAVREHLARYKAWRVERPHNDASAGTRRDYPDVHVANVRFHVPIKAGWQNPDDGVFVMTSADVAFACAPGCIIDAKAEFPSGGSVTIKGVVADRKLAVTADNVALEDIPAVITHALPIHVTAGSVSGTTSIEATSESIAVDLDLKTSRVTLENSHLAEAPVVFESARAYASIVWSRAENRLVVQRSGIMVGGEPRDRLTLSGSIDRMAPQQMSWEVRAEHVPCDPLFAALPEALRPGADDPRPRGELDAWFTLSGPAADPEHWQFAGDVSASAATDDAPTGAEYLRSTFTHQAIDDDGVTHSIVIGPSGPSYVAIASLPTHVVRAVTTAEDGGFFGHHGFDLLEIQRSIAKDVATGKRARGGSTITQQLAKNLFLSSEKTYSRKVREAFIALALESTLTKQRMLEIYLNAIEWGPNVYGIGPAAQRYFGKSPSELAPKEAAYLATIIPNPVRYYTYYAHRELPETWNERVNSILDKLHSSGVIDDNAHALAVASPVEFHAE